MYYIYKSLLSLKKIKNKSKLKKVARERLLNNFRIKYGIDADLLSKDVIKRLLSKNKHSVLLLRKYIINETKSCKKFDFEKFIDHYYPSTEQLQTTNIVEFIFNEHEIIQEKLDDLMENSSRNIVYIKSLKK